MLTNDDNMSFGGQQRVAMASVHKLMANGQLGPVKKMPQGFFDTLSNFLAMQLAQGTRLADAEAKLLTYVAELGGGKREKGRGEDDEHVVEEEIEKEVFQQYECASLAGAAFSRAPQSHPGDIAESGLLASVPLPRLQYCTKALDGCTRVLSDLQLEGALHACQRHTAVNAGVRAAFFLGDGAGVGKGRQIAAIILDNTVRGRQKHVWFSIASDLKLDAVRDLVDVGCHVGVIDGCQSLDAAAKLAFGSNPKGVLFSTYSTLISATSKRARLDQLVAWCGGPQFEGCLIFDEAHKAKNFDAKKQEASTKMSMAVIAIQERLPLARVVYASATGVTEISNMAYASRLGLWGPGTSFSDFRVFAETMDKRGVAALEMLALELKASGAYVSRGLSWAKCEFDHVTCRLDDDAVRVYDSLAAWWRALRPALERALKVIEKSGGKSKRGLTWQRFWGTQLRFFKEVQTAMKVPFVVKEAQAALDAGHCVVIGLQSTGEAGLENAMLGVAQHGDAVRGGLVSAAKVAAKRFVEDFFPVAPAEEDEEVPKVADVPDDETTRRLLQVENRPPPSDAQVMRHQAFERQATKKRKERKASQAPPVAELVDLRTAALARLEALDVPTSPLDSLIDALGGTSKVAEMTGRGARIARKDTAGGGPLKYEQRSDDKAGSACESLNVKERKAFMDGKKSIAIISDAASTGVSLHAANGTPASGKRRVHVTLELAWSADKSIQQLGRSHRANQASAPIYKLVTTNLAGENRFAAAVAKRLSSLGALTKGDRRAASGQDMADFDVDTKHGRLALTKMAAACNNRFDNALPSTLEFDADVNAPLHAALANAKRAADWGNSRAMLYDEDDDDDDELLAMLNEEAFFDRVLERSRRVLRRRATGGEPHFSQYDDATALCVLARRAYAQLEIDPKKQNEVRTFLNRLQALDVACQTLLFEYFSACHRAELAEAKRNGTLDAGLVDLRAKSVVVRQAHVVGVDELSGAKTTLSEITLDRGVSFDEATEKYNAVVNDHPAVEDDDDGEPPRKREKVDRRNPWSTGFYISLRPLPSTRKLGILLGVRKTGSANFVITRPNTGTSPFEMSLIDLQTRYKAMPFNTAEDESAIRDKWTADYLASDTEGRGARKFSIGLVSGAVLPYWRALDATATQNRGEMTQAEQALKVCRVTLDDGSKLVGIRFPQAVVPALRRNLEAEKQNKALAFANVKIQPPTPIDEKAKKLALTAPKTMTSFFKPVPKQTGPSTVAAAASRTSSSSQPHRVSSKHTAKTLNITSFFGGVSTTKKPSLPPKRANPPHEKTSLSPDADTFVECPVCNDLVLGGDLNAHLDSGACSSYLDLTQ